MTKLIIILRCIPLFALAVVWRAIQEATGYRWGWLQRFIERGMNRVEAYEQRALTRRRAIEVMKRGGNRATRRAHRHD